jgi:hypothetical protein
LSESLTNSLDWGLRVDHGVSSIDLSSRFSYIQRIQRVGLIEKSTL